MTWATCPDASLGSPHNGPGATPSGWFPTAVRTCRRGSDPACPITSCRNRPALSSRRRATAAVTAGGVPRGIVSVA